MMDEPREGHHTYREILSQPEIWRATLDRLSAEPHHQLPNLPDYDHVFFTGCGSTFFLSRWAARYCQSSVGVSASAVPASELFLFPSAWMHAGAKTLLVAVSRSAETTETLRAVEAFTQRTSGESIAVTCNPEGPLTQITRWTLAAPHAQERSVAQTRSFTSMMLLIAWLINGKRVPKTAVRLPSALRDVFAQSTATIELLGGLGELEQFFFLGSGPRYGLACEAMLKMKEMSLSHSEAYHFMELRHGPISMVNQNTLVIGLAGETGSEQEQRIMDEVQAIGSRTLLMAPSRPSRNESNRHFEIALGASLAPIWRDPLYLPPLQLLAFHRSMGKGLDPDRPANLESVVKLDE